MSEEDECGGDSGWISFARNEEKIEVRSVSRRAETAHLRTTALTVAIALFLVGVAWLIVQGYARPWTGFGPSVPTTPEIPAKTLWDWLDLLVVPLVLVGAAWMLESSRKASEARTEADRQQQKSLDDYFAFMTVELLGSNAHWTQTSYGRAVARSRTLSVLRQLDGTRKAELLQFLYETGLIGHAPIVDLNGADLRNADLEEAVLVDAELRGVYLDDASLRNATLDRADFRGSRFSNADFTGARMEATNFTQASLLDVVAANDAFKLAITAHADIQIAQPRWRF